MKKIYYIIDANKGTYATTNLTKVQEIIKELAEDYGNDYVNNGSVVITTNWLETWK